MGNLRSFQQLCIQYRLRHHATGNYHANHGSSYSPKCCPHNRGNCPHHTSDRSTDDCSPNNCTTNYRAAGNHASTHHAPHHHAPNHHAFHADNHAAGNSYRLSRLYLPLQ